MSFGGWLRLGVWSDVRGGIAADLVSVGGWSRFGGGGGGRSFLVPGGRGGGGGGRSLSVPGGRGGGDDGRSLLVPRSTRTRLLVIEDNGVVRRVPNLRNEKIVVIVVHVAGVSSLELYAEDEDLITMLVCLSVTYIFHRLL